jgi:hypothetical protein
MQTLSQPRKLADLRRGDHFYFAADVSQNVFSPRPMVKWEFDGQLRPGVFSIFQVDQSVPFGEIPKAENVESAGDVLVVRITER